MALCCDRLSSFVIRSEGVRQSAASRQFLRCAGGRICLGQTTLRLTIRTDCAWPANGVQTGRSANLQLRMLRRRKHLVKRPPDMLDVFACG